MHVSVVLTIERHRHLLRLRLWLRALLLGRQIPLRTAIFFQLEVSIHDQILPLIYFILDILYLGAVASATQQEWLHENVSGT